jgi:SAM-dependent methyltransferase
MISFEKSYPLRAMACNDCKLVQLDFDVSPEELFADYAYFSSYSESWLRHARQYCEMAIPRFALNRDSTVIEIASNDGYLLRNFVDAGIPVLGIDPSDTVSEAARKLGIPTLTDFFGQELARELLRNGKGADLIVANNVLAHVPEPNDLVAGISALLKPTGIATLEFPHVLKLIEHVEFDTIYHEHFSYYSLLSIDRLFSRHGLRIFDVEELGTHGGSLRIYVCRAGCADASIQIGLSKVQKDELVAELDQLATYERFAKQILQCRESFRTFLASAKRDGKKLVAYGAAAKGNTLLNFCGITRDDIAFVADRNPNKQGKLLPGSHIPIVSPDALISAEPDLVLILPWNLREEVMGQLAMVREWGGQFVTPVPLTKLWP